MKKTIYLFLVSLIIVIQAVANDNKIKFTEFDLDNGLHVILHQDNTTPIVVVSILYHVGSKNEDPERTGFAHFFEHLLFEGSENIKRGQFDELISNAGAVNNAYTSFDQTYYFELLPSNQLELGLYLESERLMHAKIDSIGVETQREVVKEEKRMRYDNQPYGTRWVETFSRAFDQHPYKWMPIGSMEHLNQATLEEFMDFYNTYYVPQNATLSIAGDIDIEETRKLVQMYFSEINKPIDVPRVTVVEPPQKGEKRDIVYDNIQLPMVLMAYHIPEQTAEDYYAVEMLTKILADGQSSRFYKELVDKEQIAMTTGAFTVPTEHPGLFIALGLTNTGIDAESLEAGMDAEIEKVKNQPISDQEFQKVRNQIENDFYSKNSTMAGIAESLATFHVFFGNANLINTEIENYLAVTKEEIQNAARKYLTKNNRVVLYYLPKLQDN
jgi:predicted Zn-dependent peptidase